MGVRLVQKKMITRPRVSSVIRTTVASYDKRPVQSFTKGNVLAFLFRETLFAWGGGIASIFREKGTFPHKNRGCEDVDY